MKKYYLLLFMLLLISTIIVVILAGRAIETDEYFRSIPAEEQYEI